MKEYGFEEIQQMQQKALERVQAMNAQAQKALEDDETAGVRTRPSVHADGPHPKGHIQMPANLPLRGETKTEKRTAANASPDILDNIFDDPDKALLLSLLLLFKGDKANEELMSALIYIMM